MWTKLKEQLPTILLTALLITGAAFWLHQRTVNDMAAREQAELAPLREQNDALKASAEENRRQIEATNKLLKDAISKRQADMFMTDEEVNKLNADKINALAEAVAKKVQPYNPLPKTPANWRPNSAAQSSKPSPSGAAGTPSCSPASNASWSTPLRTRRRQSRQGCRRRPRCRPKCAAFLPSPRPPRRSSSAFTTASMASRCIRCGAS